LNAGGEEKKTTSGGREFIFAKAASSLESKITTRVGRILFV
jgi:hypothetical protein